MSARRREIDRETMNEQELQELRDAKWRTDGHPIRTPEDAREFIESVGFCLMYPLRPPVLIPTFIGAWVGSNDNLPTKQHAFADPRAKAATEVMVRTLRQKFAFEAPLLPPRSSPISMASSETAIRARRSRPAPVRSIRRWRRTSFR
jgi:hypothetical protein